MAEPAIVEAVQGYLSAARQGGVHICQSILFGSYARGDADVDSDIIF